VALAAIFAQRNHRLILASQRRERTGPGMDATRWLNRWPQRAGLTFRDALRMFVVA
jgi:hypothetical protein